MFRSLPAAGCIALRKAQSRRTGKIASMKRPRFLNEPSEQDEGIPAEQGYVQELKRDWSVLHNFGVSFSIIVSLPLRSCKQS